MELGVSLFETGNGQAQIGSCDRGVARSSRPIPNSARGGGLGHSRQPYGLGETKK